MCPFLCQYHNVSMTLALCVLNCSVMSDSLRPHGLYCSRHHYPWGFILQARILEWIAMPSSRGLPNPETESRSPTLQVDSLPSEASRKPKNTGMGSLSLFQGIFPTQESNQGLLHCRWILYQLSHKGSPRVLEWVAYPCFRGSSQPRNQTRISCTSGGFLTS